jgi:hypothetical protein
VSMVSVPGKENGSVTKRASEAVMRRRKWASTVVFPISGGAPMTLSGGDDLLQHRSRRGKVRRGPSEELDASSRAKKRCAGKTRQQRRPSPFKGIMAGRTGVGGGARSGVGEGSGV